MELRNVRLSVHRKSAMATYAFRYFKLNVYIRHNEPCKNKYGMFYLSAFINPNNGNTGTEHTFNNYADFRKFRQGLIHNEFVDKNNEKTEEIIAPYH